MRFFLLVENLDDNLNEVFAQDFIEILILEQSHWDFDENFF